jgi:hypothetical protein
MQTAFFHHADNHHPAETDGRPWVRQRTVPTRRSPQTETPAPCNDAEAFAHPHQFDQKDPMPQTTACSTHLAAPRTRQLAPA